jgi:hypothetical protein
VIAFSGSDAPICFISEIVSTAEGSAHLFCGLAGVPSFIPQIAAWVRSLDPDLAQDSLDVNLHRRLGDINLYAFVGFAFDQAWVN